MHKPSGLLDLVEVMEMYGPDQVNSNMFYNVNNKANGHKAIIVHVNLAVSWSIKPSGLVANFGRW